MLGSGAHTYECVHDWLVPPAGMVWGDTHGVCQDEEGNIYVGHTVHKSSMRGEAIVVYDEGRFIRAFGEEFRGGAHGLKLRREGKRDFLYHCDINQCKVVKTTLTGEATWVHGYPREDESYIERPIAFVPTNVAFAPNGDFYVGDGYGSSHMLRFSLEGKFLGEIGRPGHGDGELDTPHGLWVDPRGERRCWSSPIAETTAFRRSRSTARTCERSKTIRACGCPATFTPRVSGWSAPTWIARCVFSIASITWSSNSGTARRERQVVHAAPSRVRNLRRKIHHSS